MMMLRPLLFLLLLGISPMVYATGSFAGRAEVQAFIAEMHDKHGFDDAELKHAFAHTKPIRAVIKAIQPPRDPAVRSWQTYRTNHIDAQRIALGLRFWQDHRDELAQVSEQSGVPEEVIVAIIGIETIYGRHTGNFGTFAALATLAFNYPITDPAKSPARAAFFRNELEELLLLARGMRRSPLSFRGSYAGALGLPQFLPSSIRRYAVDGNNDGRIDLAASPADAIASVGNFLQQHGWEKGKPVMVDAMVEGERFGELIDEGILPRRTPAEMTGYGVVSVAAPDLPAALIDLVTPQQATKYRLGFRNFYVLTRYNRSSFYATAVWELAQTLKAAL